MDQPNDNAAVRLVVPPGADQARCAHEGDDVAKLTFDGIISHSLLPTPRLGVVGSVVNVGVFSASVASVGD
jgi:hypothetical protein